MPVLRVVAIIAALMVPLSAKAETYLLMAEEAGCAWCARWNAEIGPIYPKTAEGKAVPLQRYDIHDAVPDGVSLTSRVRFTPTFLLIDDGAEVARIEGYPGEEFFWVFLTRMLDEARIPVDPAG